MSSENSVDPLGIDIEAWRQEVKVFAEETQETLNAIGDMLISSSHDTEPSASDVATNQRQQPTVPDASEAADSAGSGRLDQLRAKLAQKISEKHN